jgi:hypothetical protein
VRVDQLEQTDFPGPEGTSLPEIDANGQLRHARTVALSTGQAIDRRDRQGALASP